MPPASEAVNKAYMPDPDILRGQLIYLLSPFFSIYSTNIKRFAEKLVTLGNRVERTRWGEGQISWTIF